MSDSIEDQIATDRQEAMSSNRRVHLESIDQHSEKLAAAIQALEASSDQNVDVLNAIKALDAIQKAHAAMLVEAGALT